MLLHLFSGQLPEARCFCRFSAQSAAEEVMLENNLAVNGSLCCTDVASANSY